MTTQQLSGVTAGVICAGVGLAGLYAFVTLLTRASEPEERVRLLRWTMGSFFVHVAVGVAIDLLGFARADTDGFYYNMRATQVVDHWVHGLPVGRLSDGYVFPPGQSGYFYLLSWTYRLLGPHPTSGIIINAAIASGLVPVMAQLTRHLFGPDAARPVPAIVVFTPGFLAWTSQLLREAGVLFLVAVAAYNAVKLSQSLVVKAIFGFGIAVAALFTFRGYVAIVVGVGLILGLLLAQGRSVHRVLAASGAFATVAVLVFSVGLGRASFRAMNNSTFKDAHGLRAAQLANSRSGVAPTADTSTPVKALLSMPQLAPRFLLGPFPWEYRSQRQLAAIPDVLAWWFFLPSFCRGVVSGARRARRSVWILLLPAILGTIALSFLIAEYGTVIRSRLQVMLLLVPFIALGLSERKQSRRVRTMSGEGDAMASRNRKKSTVVVQVKRAGAWRGSLAHALKVANRCKWPIFVVMLLVTAGSLGLARYTSRRVTYEARAEILLRPQTTGVLGSNPSAVSVQNEIRVLLSKPIRDGAEAKLGKKARVSARAVPETSTFLVLATDRDPQTAADVANTFADVYLSSRREQESSRVAVAIQQTQDEIGAIQKDIDELWSAILGTSGDRRGTLEQDFLVARRDALVGQAAELNRRLSDLKLRASAAPDEAALIAPAVPPDSPIEPRTKVIVLGVIAAILGIGVIVYAAQKTDDVVRTRADVERAISDVPIVGRIPMTVERDEERRTRRSPPISLSERGGQTEAYHALRSSLGFLLDGRKVLQVTTPEEGGGTSAVAAHLADSFARVGRSVVVVSGDVRRPRLHQYFGVSNTIGFTSVVGGSVSLSDAIRRVPGRENLYVLASGPAPPDPAAFVSSKRFQAVLRALREHAEVVVVDSPPVLAVADAVVAASAVDAVLLVAAEERTSRTALAQSVALLRQVHAPLLGVALNCPIRDGFRHVACGYSENGKGARRPAHPPSR